MPVEALVRGGLLVESRDAIRAGLARQSRCALLDSARGFGRIGRFSIYAARPRGIFQAIGNHWTVSADWPGRRPPVSADPLAALRALLAQTATAEGVAGVFCGGWIGYVGYDVAGLLERLPRRWPRDGALPDLDLAYYDTFAVHDNESDSIQLYAVDRFSEGESANAARLAAFERLLEAAPIPDCGAPLVAEAPRSNFDPDEYCWTIERILEYIRAGDIFQANFSHRFSARLTGSVEQLFFRSLGRSPAPFAALLRGGSWSVISTSPERFFLLEPDARVETRPIKGTRPRGRDGICDLLLRADLAASAKDRAELTMIVDLERNDLGRVCQYGSVRVSAHAQVESFSNVHHLVSTVEGRLRPECDRVDLVAATFPGGSVTGAPKIRAMQIIDERERCRRGVYTGAIGYFSDDGRADFSIAIRTLVVDGDQVHYHVGGGIVADSEPLAEYRETLTKGLRLRQLLVADE